VRYGIPIPALDAPVPARGRATKTMNNNDTMMMIQTYNLYLRVERELNQSYLKLGSELELSTHKSL